MPKKPVLVIGATGYVGGRLVPRLLRMGYRVRAFGRSLPKLAGRSWSDHPDVELVEGDVLDLSRLKQAAEGAGVAYYLAQSPVSEGTVSFENEAAGAANMARVAADTRMDRIIHLDALASAIHPEGDKYPKRREDVSSLLRAGRTPVTTLRPALIIGSGSASFEIFRHLVDRLPILPVPSWVGNRVQPISIRNVLDYLTGCLLHPETMGKAFDIGGPDILTYAAIFDLCSDAVGLPRRKLLTVPFMSPLMSALVVHFVTPVPLHIARFLLDNLPSELICRENHIREIIGVELLDCADAIRRACEKSDLEAVETHWSDAGPLRPPEWVRCGDAPFSGGTILECGYRALLAATPEEIWDRIVRIGGETSWYYAEALWRMRGWMDGFVGGVGLKRGRRHSRDLQVGDALDFWRVLAIDPPHRLVLLAEMKTPGEAVLEFLIVPSGVGYTEIRMLSRFRPRGLAGLAYWYGLYPFHEWIFGGMLKTVAKLIGKPVVQGPSRFTPKIPPACRFAPGETQPPAPSAGHRS